MTTGATHERRRPPCKWGCTSEDRACVAWLASHCSDQAQIVPSVGPDQNTYVSLAAQPKRFIWRQEIDFGGPNHEDSW